MPAEERYRDEEEARPLTERLSSDVRRKFSDSPSTESAMSIVLERLRQPAANGNAELKSLAQNDELRADDDLEDRAPTPDLRDEVYSPGAVKPIAKRARFLILGVATAFLIAWLIALLVFVGHRSAATRGLTRASLSSGKKITLDQILGGHWRPRTHEISWIEGANGEDGLLLERAGGNGKDYLVVEDVRSRSTNHTIETHDSKTLMVNDWFRVKDKNVFPSDVWPSRNLQTVLVMSERHSVSLCLKDGVAWVPTDELQNWRHSFTGKYWLFDVATQTGQALDPANPEGIIQLASWSPESDAVIFTRDNNLFLRKLSSPDVKQITKDGGTELFYGVPDWVYEEEVFAGNSATWWAEDGKFVAFLRTNETMVPEYPIQYFVSRPSGERPPKGLENYPEVREIKYPKAGAPNPVVDLHFYDVQRDQVFTVDIAGDFPDPDRLITEVVWAGSSGKVVVRETNRESDVLYVVLIDVLLQTGQVVRTVDVNALDGGWFEVSQETRYIPADPSKGRVNDGYVDMVIHDGYDHLAYFTPMDNATPKMLTTGSWEVVTAPAAVDLNKNLVYFVGTRESPIQRQIYSVKLDGSGMTPVTDTSKEGYYDVSFSKGAGYALLSYSGPDIPWQEVINTPSNENHYVQVIEENKHLAEEAAKYEMPVEIYQNVTIDGFTLQVVERRPPHFDPKEKYPVLFYLYGGPGSQMVHKKWGVDFQAYVAANLGYIVVTVDGRGTGFIGRKARCIIRGNIGYYEAKDQIETAKIWAAKDYVDEERIAIWGWSYGGFLTLKTIEQDAGKTFKYGMAVAPVTDWRFYDSVYTERYMHTPQHNPSGYENASISDMKALQQNVRFLLMHGVADDNVHMQNSLTLLDKLDLAGVENYDVHVFPDSDHSIYFHNANRMVYDRLSNWLINAFNGEWLRTQNAAPMTSSEMDASLSSSRRR
ncbi:MAG: hypothetical protein M1816_005381 [Peltula sp. TS41687]|nr:MAG: hypothetical protein M1816_005381 [Peltula sp. TS41687]